MKHFKLTKGLLACLLSLALVLTLVGPVGTTIATSGSGAETSGSATETSGSATDTPAEEPNVITAAYNPTTDTIVFEGTKAGKVYYATVKAKGSKIGTKFGELTLDSNFKAELVLDDATKGLKAPYDKDLYLWYSTTEPKAKTSYKPVLTVNAGLKKYTVSFNYMAAGDATKSGIAKITTKVGKNVEEIPLEDVVYRYAKDGAKKDGNSFTDTWLSATTLKGDVLATAIADAADKDNKPAFEFKIVAKAATEEQTVVVPAESAETTPSESAESTSSESAELTSSESAELTSSESAEPTTKVIPAKNASRASKVLNIAVKAAAKAPGAKVDYKTGTVSIKNGFDYAVLTNKDAEPAPSDWITVLPAKKGGTATSVFMKTEDYVPNSKVTADTKQYFVNEKTKIKNISVADLFKDVEGDTIYVFVRKTAQATKAASQVVKLTIKKAEAAPTFADSVIEGVKGKKGYSYTLLPKTESLATAEKTYQYLVVKSTDDDTVITNPKAKWSALTEKGIKIDNKKIKADGTCDIVIRKAPVTSGENPSLASEYVRTRIETPVTSGSGDAETSKVSWIKVDGPVSSGSGDQTSNSGENTATAFEVELAEVEHATVKLTYGTDKEVAEGAKAEIEKDTKVTIAITADDSYVVDTVVVGSDKIEAAEGVYKFTVSAAVKVTVTMKAEE